MMEDEEEDAEANVLLEKRDALELHSWFGPTLFTVFCRTLAYSCSFPGIVATGAGALHF